jgi:hypothetical protein
MVAKHRSFGRGGRLLLGLALGMPCLMAGCGDKGSGQPAPVDPAVQEKNRKIMSGGYRQDYLDLHKAEGKSGKAAAKQGP